MPAALVFLGLAFIVWFFTSAPWLQVKHIRIEGEATEAVIKEIEKLRGQNILWLSITKPESVIVKHQPSIKEIQILRGIPDTLRIKLIEREPAVVWQVGETWYTADPTGFIYREEVLSKKPDGSPELPATELPVVVDTKGLPVAIGEGLIRSDFIRFIQVLKERLPKEFELQFVRAEVAESTFNVAVVTDAGWKILFDTTRKIDPQLRTLQNVLEAKRSDVKEYIDLRVRGWVYYK